MSSEFIGHGEDFGWLANCIDIATQNQHANGEVGPQQYSLISNDGVMIGSVHHGLEIRRSDVAIDDRDRGARPRRSIIIEEWVSRRRRIGVVLVWLPTIAMIVIVRGFMTHSDFPFFMELSYLSTAMTLYLDKSHAIRPMVYLHVITGHRRWLNSLANRSMDLRNSPDTTCQHPSVDRHQVLPRGQVVPRGIAVRPDASAPAIPRARRLRKTLDLEQPWRRAKAESFNRPRSASMADDHRTTGR